MSAVQAQKKPGGAGVKLFQAIKAVNQGCSVTLPLPLPVERYDDI